MLLVFLTENKYWNALPMTIKQSSQKEFTVKKAIKTKDDKLYDTWAGYDSSFNSWIDNKHNMDTLFSRPESLGGRFI